MTPAPAYTVVAKMAPMAMKAPPSTLSTNRVSGSMVARLTPASSARSAMVAGRIASRVTSCGRVASFRAVRSSMNSPASRWDGCPLPAGSAGDQQAHNLHRDDLHDGHRREDHGIADVGPLGRRHAGRIDQDG